VRPDVPPLDRRRPAARVAWRAALWRWRAVVAALGVGVAASAALSALRPPAPDERAVVVAARDLPAGATLTAADLRVARLPADVAPRAGVGRDDLVGRATAVPVPAGLPVVPDLLASGDLAGPPGTVVAAVRFADPAMAGLLTPGTRVDVLAAAAETGAQGVVVARRALVLPVAPGDDEGWSVGAGDADAPPVLLAVTPDEAAALSGAAVTSLLSAVVVP